MCGVREHVERIFNRAQLNEHVCLAGCGVACCTEDSREVALSMHDGLAVCATEDDVQVFTSAYLDHNHIGHTYVGHNYVSLGNIGHNHVGHTYAGINI